MFSEEYSRYTLLMQRNNSSLSLDRRTVILVIVLTLPIFIFCVSYVTLFGIYEKIVYPQSSNVKVSQHSLHRAVLYNAFSNEGNVTQDLHFKVGQSNDVPTYKLVCYYNFPTNEQSLQVKDLDASLCTHINAAFAEIVNNSMVLDNSSQNVLTDLVKLKEANKNLKILLCVGGAGKTSGYLEMVMNHANRKRFIQSVLYYVKNYNIDGVDLDWEFPNEDPDGDKHQRMHFTQLLQELRHTVNIQTKYKFLISVAVAAPTTIIDNSYDVPYMNEYVDYINLMAYDYHFYTKITPFTGINSPLYATSSEKFYLASLNINYTTNYWNYLGMDRTKIIVGLPTYGHTFTLANARNDGLYAPALGIGKLGSLGFVDYPQVCSFLSSNHISPVFDMDTKSPYASKAYEWISFDNTESFMYKTEFIRDNKFGGVMVYCLNSDDHQGVCQSPEGNGKKFPLTKVVGQILMQRET